MKTRQHDDVSCDIDNDREIKRPKATMDDPPLGCLRTARRAPPKSATTVDADDAFARTEVSALTLLSHSRGKGAANDYVTDAESRLGFWRSWQIPLPPKNDSVTNSALHDNNQYVGKMSEANEAPKPALAPIYNEQIEKIAGTGPQNDASSQEQVNGETAAEIKASQPALAPIINEQIEKTAGAGPQNDAASQEQLNKAGAAEIEASNPASLQINNVQLDVTAGTVPKNDAASQGKVHEATAATKATPILNFSTSPKQLLNERYSKIFNLSSSQLKCLKNNYYTTCKHDSMGKFAAVFTCPVSGEHFMCGKLKNNVDFIEDEEGLVWYSNTKLATTAAAARAMDCFVFRDFMRQNQAAADNTNMILPQYSCLDMPYLNDCAPALPKSLRAMTLPISMDLGGNTVAKASTIQDGHDGNATVEVEPEDKGAASTREDTIVSGPTEKQIVFTQQSSDRRLVEHHDVHRPLFVPNKSNNENNKPPLSNTVAFSPLSALKLLPKQELNEYYTRLGLSQSQISKLKNYYVVWSCRFPREVRYTSIFTCPLTLESFACGHIPDKNGGVIVHDSLFWFTNKKLATDAAAAKALDCFAFRECYGSEEKPDVRCLDLPYLKRNSPSVPTLPDGVILPTSSLTVSNNPESVENTHPFLIESTKTIISTSGDSSNDTPKQALYKWYEAYWRRINKTSFTLSHSSAARRVPEKDSFSTWSNMLAKSKSSTKLFTSVFVCPWTGERFLSGKLVDKQMECLEQDFDLKTEGSKEVQTKTLIWYRTKKDAENAAAGRALDCFYFRSSNKESVTVLESTKYCTDPPYGADDSPLNERDITQRLTGVMEIYNECCPPIFFQLPWKVIPIEERIHIRHGVDEFLFD